MKKFQNHEVVLDKGNLLGVLIHLKDDVYLFLHLKDDVYLYLHLKDDVYLYRRIRVVLVAAL